MQREKMLIRGIVSLLILDILLDSELYGYAIKKKAFRRDQRTDS